MQKIDYLLFLLKGKSCREGRGEEGSGADKRGIKKIEIN